MTLTRELIGKNEDNSPHYHYTYDGPEGGGLVRTGPVSGSVQLADGTVYDVGPEVIEHAPGHGNAIAFHIAKMHEKSGHLTRIIHGEDYAGPLAVTVDGDESEFSLVHNEIG
jgi:hypothetical protein